VPYDVQTARAVTDYLARLAAEEISPEAIVSLVEEYTQELGERADYHLERNPVAHESFSFHYDTVLIDGNRLYEFTFIVDAGPAPFGVVVVVYVEHRLLGERRE
jgi:hypothetical protein